MSKTHYEKALEQIETVKELGLEITPQEKQAILDHAKILDIEDYNASVQRQQKFLEASLIEYSITSPNAVLTVECRNCHEKFQTNYKFQKYCSLECLSTAMQKLGLSWDPEKPATERWKGLPPTTIRPETLKQLLKWARELIDAYENPDTGLKKHVFLYQGNVALQEESPDPPELTVVEDES